MTQLAFIARFSGEDWVELVHGETRAKAAYRFAQNHAGDGDYIDVRLRRLPGQDDKPFDFDTAKASGFTFDNEDGHYDEAEMRAGFAIAMECRCELCGPKVRQ